LPEAPRAGADLRAARERLAWPLPEVARTLHIRAAYLEALEGGYLGLLPSNAHALGFIRAYANALGLNPDEMLRRFRAEAATVGRRTELEFPAPVPERGLPAGAVVLLGLALATAVYAGWYKLSGDGRLPAETVMAVPERLAPLVEQAARSPRKPVAMSAEAPPAVPPPQPEPDLTPVAPTYSPSSAAAAQLVPPAPPPPVITGTPDSPGDRPRLLLRANADAWMQVKDRSGTILFNRVLKAGETWPVPQKPNLLLTTGNAGGTEIVLDGASMASLGPSGSVRRDVPLDVDALKDGKFAAGVSPVAATRAQQ
jgi:cytoskeleton protein RodZ